MGVAVTGLKRSCDLGDLHPQLSPNTKRQRCQPDDAPAQGQGMASAGVAVVARQSDAGHATHPLPGEAHDTEGQSLPQEPHGLVATLQEQLQSERELRRKAEQLLQHNKQPAAHRGHRICA